MIFPESIRAKLIDGLGIRPHSGSRCARRCPLRYGHLPLATIKVMKALDGISDDNDIAYAIAEGCRVYTEHHCQTGDQASGEIAYSLLVSDNAVMGATCPM
ncbi:hypothetical protein [Pseudomonas putida]|uniref:hypothetical protein n=1 Tax=Pseudomonas putida TaxID=303 RepID=UPI0009537D0E|nr:hypothetical protein [Pseudomonas putida]SIR96160.1 hypothetical protein SAMN05216501_2940 [Pseudomonas putida]